MQSGYGVSEIPQFLVDGLCSPLFPPSATTTDHHHHPQPHQHNTPNTTPPYHLYHYHPQQQHHQLQQFYHHIHQQQQPPSPLPPLDPPPPRFSFLHSAPITQQLFDQTTTHIPFHLFDHHRRAIHTHLGLDHDSPPPSAAPSSPGIMNFRLAVDGSNSKDGLNDDDGLLVHADEDAGESRVGVNLWPPQAREEDPAIKEPFWRPLDLDYIDRNRKRCEDAETLIEEESSPKHLKETKESVPASEDATNSATNYKLFSELEAICKPGATAAVANVTMGNNNPTGSSSALTGDNRAAPPAPTFTEFATDRGSNASTGEEEGSLKGNVQKSGSATSSKMRRRKRRKQQLSCITGFFESLVKQLMDHQEALHRRFLEVLENRDRERAAKEKQWRELEAIRTADEARVRAEQQAVVAARESAIVSFLEKITGQPVNLPTRAQFENEENTKLGGSNNNTVTEGSDDNRATMNSNRWPKAEVQTLIKVRSELEPRFQEPGLKGSLWEEVSLIMGTMGYSRGAKRCKEKWENINKYFRKTKESNKKRPQHSKTCPYFDQLDQLYSKYQNNETPIGVDRRGNSELLDAILVSTDHAGSSSHSDQIMREAGQAVENEQQECEDDEEEDEDEEEDGNQEEGEGEAHCNMMQS